MKEILLPPGSPEWAKSRSASKAAAMLGFDKKTSRLELMHMMFSGIGKEFSDWQQRNLLDKGNITEVGARALAEEVIGEGLSPQCFATDDDYLTAAPDGITFAGSVGFEAKTWNEKLAASVRANDIPNTHWPQLEQQIFVCGLDYVLFMVSDGTPEKTVSMEYRAVPGRMESIINGWHQFDKDLAAYVPVEVIDAPQADPIQSLPAVVIQVSGELTLCNLDAVTPKFDLFLSKAEEGKGNIDIHNGKAIAEFSRAAAVDCKLTAKAVVSQMSSVSEAVSKLELYAKKFDAMGLFYEKEVDRLKEIEKVAALNKAKAEYAAHLAALQAEIEPLRLIVPVVDFALAIKGLKTPESKNNALNTALAHGKIEADAIAKDLRAKLAWFKKAIVGEAGNYSFMFPDLQQIIAKPLEDFQLLVNTRIAEHRKEEEERQAAWAESFRIEAEKAAYAKTEAEAQAARIAQDTSLMPTVPTIAEDRAKMIEQIQPTASVNPIIKPLPTDKEIIGVLQGAFRCTYGQACNYILAVAENLRMAA